MLLMLDHGDGLVLVQHLRKDLLHLIKKILMYLQQVMLHLLLVLLIMINYKIVEFLLLMATLKKTLILIKN